MSRWIDADAFIENLNKIFNENKDAMDFMSIAVAREFINSTEKDINNEEIAPSIDIVRCKECRWWFKNLTEDDEDEAYLHCPIEYGKPDDFCSYGERAEQTEPNSSEKPNNCEPQTYVINPQEPTNDDKCFECDDFFTCGGQCNKIEDEPQTDCAWK